MVIDAENIEQKLLDAINNVMVGAVTDMVKETIAMSVEDNVYPLYTPVLYQRRGRSNGGLADTDAMNSTYDPTTMKLEVWSTGGTAANGGNVADIVERGTGYSWRDSEIARREPFPRPFHKPAEQMLIEQNAVEEFLEAALKTAGFEVR